ncbi:MAG: hypothetical protein ACE5HU_09515 [Acidobacteriota bacterium]
MRIESVRPLSSSKAAAVVSLVLVLVAPAAGCRRRSPEPLPGIPFPTSTISRKLNTFVFEEDSRAYLMTVGVNAARFHDQDPFVPFSVVVANKMGPAIRLDRESFTLVDPVTGARYGLAGINEVRRQGKQLYDRQLLNIDLDGFGTKLSGFHRLPSNFFPFQGIVIDHLEIHEFQYMADNLYFPRPEGELLGKRFELHLNSRGLEQDLFVVFTIPEN